MRGTAKILIVVLGLVAATSAQTFSDDLAKARSIKPLEATSEDVMRIFADNSSPFSSAPRTFSLANSVIEVTYSSGQCSTGVDEDFLIPGGGVGSDDWSVPAGKVVLVEITPKEHLQVRDIPVGSIKLTRDRLYTGRDDHFIHYNKREGVAISARREGLVESITFFPRHTSNYLLCPAQEIRTYYSKREWKRGDTKTKIVCVLLNMRADVVGLDITASGNNVFQIETTATDPENDVLTYSYKITAGRLVGQGPIVIWDLSGVTAGTYSIAAGVDDGMGIVGRTISKTVVIK